MNDWTMRASHQWATRPADQRFTSLDEMLGFKQHIQDHSRATVVPSRRVHALPENDHKGLLITSPADEAPYAPTNWSFGQIAQLAEAPGRYLRTLPAEIAADCINYGLQFKRDMEDVGFLLSNNGGRSLRAATGPRYGRIWDTDVIRALQKLPPDWKVPSEFGETENFKVSKDNTTLYTSDRDMFVFLADEQNRVTVSNRRDGKPGTLARGIYVWNSEVGDKMFGLGMFLFDFACMNRIVWGGQSYEEVTIRHSASAPDRFIEQILPTLEAYQQSSVEPMERKIAAAQAAKVADKLDDFLSARFSNKAVQAIKTVHELEEGRPIETLWDVTTAATAYARGIAQTDNRVEVERIAGKVLDLAV